VLEWKQDENMEEEEDEIEEVDFQFILNVREIVFRSLVE